MLKFFTASTNLVNTKRAITECLEVALKGQPDLSCDLIIIYSAMGHNFKELLTEARKLSNGARIAGCTCGGIIGGSGPDESMKALAIMAIKGPKEEFAITCIRKGKENNPYKTAQGLARELKDLNPNINMIQFLACATTIQFYPMEKSLEGIKSVFGKNIPVFGGGSTCSLANMKTEMSTWASFLFFDDEVLDVGGVMIGYADPTLKFSSHASHGFDVLKGLSLKVTESDRNFIYEINHKPARSMVLEALGLPESASATEMSTIIKGFAKEIPEHLWEENRSKYLISGFNANIEDKSIGLIFECSAGMEIWFIKRDETMMFDGVDQMVSIILNDLQGRKPLAVFHADCQLRGKYSLDRILKEGIINRMQSPICKDENIPWFGFYAGGEFFMLGGEAWFQMISSSLFVLYR